MEYVQAGGYIDLTASYTPAERPGSLTVLESLKRLIRAGIPLDHVTMSSDSNATRMLPDKRIKYLSIQTLFQVTRELWQSGEIPRLPGRTLRDGESREGPGTGADQRRVGAWKARGPDYHPGTRLSWTVLC